MANKKIDLSQSVYELCTKHPVLVDVLINLGFGEIANPGMLSTVGRIMTIPKGTKMKHIDMYNIKQKLLEVGFTTE